MIRICPDVVVVGASAGATAIAAPALREPTCVQVRAYIGKHSEAAAVVYARRQGFRLADILRIRKRCLPR